MQIIGLHKNLYKLYAYSLSQECLDVYRNQYEDGVRRWSSLKVDGVCDQKCQQFSGISRSTYYRYKRELVKLKQDITPPSKRPKSVNKPLWGESEKQRILRIRREDTTYGKEKIAVIINRDHDKAISASTVGRILTILFDKGLIVKPRSALRPRKVRNFNKSQAKPWAYKDYKTMKLGERV